MKAKLIWNHLLFMVFCLFQSAGRGLFLVAGIFLHLMFEVLPAQRKENVVPFKRGDK